MLFCTAGGEPGKRDIVFGGRIARRTGASTTLLYVDTTGESYPAITPQPVGAGVATIHRTRPWIERHLEEGARTLLNQGIRTEVRVREGPVVEEILSEAAEGDYDLIVVGGHVSRAALRFPDHDLATLVVARADRPVLVVRGHPGA
jgi:nucleotide-binding universal stress UspA family protein